MCLHNLPCAPTTNAPPPTKATNPQNPIAVPKKDPAEIAAVATQLLAGTSDLSTPASVNLFLGNLLTQLAHNKISRKNAIAMAYISQLLLNSISVKHRQDRDAQAAQLQAEANAPQRIVIDVPRPCFRQHADEDPNEPNDNYKNCHPERSEGLLSAPKLPIQSA